MQETTGNILKHAHASLIHIALDEHDEELAIDVRHDGQWNQQAETTKGIGLRTIHDRLKTIGGNYKIENRDGGISMQIRVRLHGKNHGFQ